jgi:myo-inositol 2-dehydrogenase/D-chiro-inositol 1-dehydrogenase
MTQYRVRDPDAIGVAVIGCGRIGLVHAANVASIPNVRVVVAADLDPAAAESGRAVTKAERATTDPLAAIADREVEAILLATPTDSHAPLIRAALRSAKAVFTEKPLASDLRATRQLVREWRNTGVPLQVGFMRRFDPGYVAAKRLIEAGELGRIEQFRAYSRDAQMPSLEFLHRSGGAFVDMSVHDFDLARFLVGDVIEVFAWGSVLYDDRLNDLPDVDTAIVALRFANGALGVVEMARHSRWGYDIRTEIAGVEGKVIVEASNKTPITLSRQGRSELDHFAGFEDRFADAYKAELNAFVEALAQGAVPAPGPDDALETMRVALAARDSWHRGRPVRVARLG